MRSVDGVEEAAGYVSFDRGALLDRDGDPILSNGPPTIIVASGPDRFDPFDYTEGGPPQTDDQVVLDKATADKYDFDEGDKVTVVGRTPKKEYTVSGVGRLGDSENFGGSRLVVMTLPEAQRVSGHDGYDDISVAAANGTSPEELKAAIAAELGPQFTRADRQGAGGEVGLRPLRRARLHPHRAARVRRRRRAGRRLPDLQHLQRHRRPAHARVRAAAHARRLARRSCCARCCSRPPSSA